MTWNKLNIFILFVSNTLQCKARSNHWYKYEISSHSKTTLFNTTKFHLAVNQPFVYRQGYDIECRFHCPELEDSDDKSLVSTQQATENTIKHKDCQQLVETIHLNHWSLRLIRKDVYIKMGLERQRCMEFSTRIA